MQLGGLHEALAKTERGSAKGRTWEEGGKEGRKASVRKDGTNGVVRGGRGGEEGKMRECRYNKKGIWMKV